MLKIAIIITLNFLIATTHAQNINYSGYSYIRAGFANQIRFSTDFTYDSVQFRLNGIICNSDSNYVTIYPKKAGIDTLYSTAFYKGNIIYANEFPLTIMKPEVFGVFSSNLLTKVKLNLIKKFPGVVFNIKTNSYHWEPIGIDTYRFSIIRSDKVIFSVQEFSNRFSELVKKQLETLKVGDLILISEIVVNGPFKAISNPLPTIYEIEL